MVSGKFADLGERTLPRNVPRYAAHGQGSDSDVQGSECSLQHSILTRLCERIMGTPMGLLQRNPGVHMRTGESIAHRVVFTGMEGRVRISCPH